MSAKDDVIALSMHLMPLMWREFQVRVVPQRVVDDPAYAQSVVDVASTSREPRLVHYAARLRCLLQGGGAAPPAQPGSPSSGAAPAPQPELEPAAPTPRYIKSLR